MKGYPVFLILEGKRCVVIGGGHEAERKVAGLLDCNGNVTVIAQNVTSEIRQWADAGKITWIERDYQSGDLEGAQLVIAERSDPTTNARIYAEAGNALVNVMDDIPHCNFMAGAVVRQGPLTIAISTNGAAPTLAVRLREKMEGEFGPEYAVFLDLMQQLRDPMARHYPSFQQRRDLWYALVDSDILALLRRDDLDAALRTVAEIVGPEVVEEAGLLTGQQSG